MSAVDVLAVLDWFAYPEARPEIGTVARATKGRSIDDLRQARAALFKLIEADKEIQDARARGFAISARLLDRQATALANIGAAP